MMFPLTETHLFGGRPKPLRCESLPFVTGIPEEMHWKGPAGLEAASGGDAVHTEAFVLPWAGVHA